MRKTIALLLCAAALLMAFAGCAKKEPNIVFTGTVADVSDKSILVTTEDKVSFDKASVSYAPELKLSFEPAVGQVVKITIQPEIRESYPVQVTAVAIELVSEPASPDPGQADYTASFFRADSLKSGNWEYITSWCVNNDMLAISSVKHIPVIVIDSAEALSDFISEGITYFQFDTAYNDQESFSKNAAKYDDAFFKDNTLLILYAEETSGPIRHEIKNTAISGGTLSVKVKSVAPEVGTDDMAEWFILLEVPNSELTSVTKYDAYYPLG